MVHDAGRRDEKSTADGVVRWSPPVAVVVVVGFSAVVAGATLAFGVHGWSPVGVATLLVLGGISCAVAGAILWLRADTLRSDRLGVLAALFVGEAALGLVRLVPAEDTDVHERAVGGSTLVSLLAAYALAAGALLATWPPRHSARSRLLVVVASVGVGGVLVRLGNRVPEPFDDAGAVNSWARVLWVVAAVAVVGSAAELWHSQRVQVVTDWVIRWPLLGVLLGAAGVVLRALSGHQDDALWWASLVVTSVAGVVAAAGLVHGAASLLGRLEGFAEELAVSLETEVRLAGVPLGEPDLPDPGPPPAGSAPLPPARNVAAVLAGRELTVVLQAVVDLPTGAVVGVEALTRLVGQPPMSPAELFDAAADAGVSRDVELLAVRRALELLPRLPAETWLALNVSPATASGADLADLLRHVDRRRVVLELTEHAEVRSYDTLVDALNRLRDGGVRIAVDDAGAGFSSFRHVIRLHPDIVKLDMSLIAGIDTDPVRRALVSSLVGFTRSIGAAVIAEGIETRSEFEVLRSHGVRLGQGYLLGHPRAVADAFTVTLPDTAAAGASGGVLRR